MLPHNYFIELPENPSPTLALAGEELANYLTLTTGMRPVREPSQAGHRFGLGTAETSFFFRNLLNYGSVDPGDDGFRLVSNVGSTTLVARTDKGVLNAVYFFIEQKLDVRWVEPGPLGEVLPRRRVMPWWPANTTEVPVFRIRGMHVTENTQWYREEDVVRHLEWMGRARLNRLVVYSNYSYERLRKVIVEECRRRGITLEVEIISHNQFLPMEMFDEHPEYFAELDGERVGRSFTQRCASNEEGIELFTANAVRWVREHPEVDVVSLMSNDGRGYCRCESCRDMKPNEQWSKFLYPTLEALKEEFPERLFTSRAYCYRYDPLPEDRERRAGTGLMFDTFIRCRWHELGSRECPVETRNPDVHDAKGESGNVYLLRLLREWKRLTTGPLYVFENTTPHGLLSLPAPNPEVFSRDMTTYHSMGLDGILVQGHTHSFGTYILNFNLFARKAWDIDVSYRGLWPDLCVRYFGGYGVRVMDFIERLRQAVQRGGYCEGVIWCRLDEDDWPDLDELLGFAPDGEVDVFGERYKRFRQSFVYMRALARLGAAGRMVRDCRERGDRAGAVASARDALRYFGMVWGILNDNFDSGLFDTFDIKAKLLVRAFNTDELIERFDWFPRPFWYSNDPNRRLIFWDYLEKLESAGMTIDEIFAHLRERFTEAREAMRDLSGRVEEVIDYINFGYG